MHEVSKGEFFAALYAERRDIHPRITNDHYPYTSSWETRARVVWGVSRGYWPADSALPVTKYFIAEGATRAGR